MSRRPRPRAAIRWGVALGAAVLCAASAAQGATRYWVAGSGSFGDPAHWSASSGGTGGAGVPGSADDAYFDASSGAATIVLGGDVSVRDLVVTGTASSSLTLDFQSSELTCTRDCLLGSGRLAQGIAPASRLVAGRNLDTAGCFMSAVEPSNLTVELAGDGWWRYSLDGNRQPRLWKLIAAQPGRTTTLRPVGAVPIGVDIDVESQLVLGDSGSVLNTDLAEMTGGGGRVTIEIHHDGSALDIAANGARLAVGNLERELSHGLSGTLQTDLVFDGLTIYDVTGAHGAPRGAGPTWRLNGPLDVGQAQISVEKTAVLDVEGFDVHAGVLWIGGGSLGTGEVHVDGGEVTLSQRITLSYDHRPGILKIDEGLVVAPSMEVRGDDGFVTGGDGVLELTGSAPSESRTYYASAAGNDANSGLSPSTPVRTFARAAAFVAPGNAVLFRRGDRFDLGDQGSIEANGGRVGAYGTGDRPVLALAADGELQLAGDRFYLHDLRIEFGTGTGGRGVAPLPPVLLPE